MNRFKSKAILSLLFSIVSTLGFAQLHINECMPSNDAFIVDDAGEYEDWIEIYNASGVAIDLGGYFLSDDPTELQKWQIPNAGTETTCPAGGFLLFWADNDEDQGNLHAGFKLSASGETIFLVGPDGSTILDELSFPGIASDIAFGRFPDGGSNLSVLPSPSPGATNTNGGDVFVNVEYELPIQFGSDDGIEIFNTNFLNKNLVNMGADGGSPTVAAYRFRNIGLTPNAIIEEAYLQFTAGTTTSTPASFTIYGSAELSAAEMVHGVSTADLTNRPRLSTTVDWNAPAWETNDRTDAQKTPDLSGILQEWIGLNAWEGGNDLMILLEGNAQRDAFAFEGAAEDNLAHLIIKARLPLSNTLKTSLKINEIAASGTDYTDETGAFEDWVEILNTSGSEVDLTGLFLTDSKNDLAKWSFPTGAKINGNEYKIVFTDKDNKEGPFHTNFQLKGKDDWLGLVQLTNTGFNIIDSIAWTDIPFQAVLGRKPDATGDFRLLGDITPETSNNASRLFLYPPMTSIEAGMYNGTQSVGLSHVEAGVSFYYTLDGALPSTSATLYTGPVSISSTTVLRAIATKSGFTPSEPMTASYILNENSEVPILSITSDPDNFFDDEIGIYVVGTNGVINYCAPAPANYAQDWERPGNIQLFHPDGTMAFSADAGIKIAGACSRNQPMKSLAISTREQQYGTEKFAEALFPERDGNDYFRLKVRNSGQDYYRIGFRDMMNQKFMFGLDEIELQAGITTQLFLNGEFWGIHNIREKFAGEYFERLYGVNENDVNVIKSPGQIWMDIKEGSPADYMTLFEFMNTTADMNVEADYETFTDEIDINSFISYWVVMSYMANNDWPENNIAIWKEQKTGKKWKYCVTDTDGSTYNELSEETRPNFDVLAKISDMSSNEWDKHKDATLFLRKLWERDEFNYEFAQRSCSVMGIVFPEERTHPMIDSIVTLFTPMVQRHIDRWHNAEVDKYPMGGGMTEWTIFVNFYKDFWTQRPDFYRGFLKSKFNLGEDYTLNFDYDANTNGTVYVNWNEMEIPYDYSNEYFRDIPLRVKAVADPGYKFINWLETGDTESEMDFVFSANQTLTPIFEIDPESTYEPLLADKVKVFPNPAFDFVYIENETGHLIEELMLHDMTGKILHVVQENFQSIDISDLPAGIVGISLKLVNGKRVFKKLMVVK